EFARIEELEDGDLVPRRREVADLLLQFVDRGEQVREEDDEAALADQLVQTLHRRAEVGALAEGRLFELEENLPQLPRPVPRGKVAADAAVEGGQPYRVLLPHQEVGERRG